MLEFLDNIFPLVVIYLIWRKFTRVKKTVQDKPEPVAPEPPVSKPEQSVGEKKVTVNPLAVLRQIMGGVLDVPSQEVLAGKQPPSEDEEVALSEEGQPLWDYEAEPEVPPLAKTQQVRKSAMPPVYTIAVPDPKHEAKRHLEKAEPCGGKEVCGAKTTQHVLAGTSRKKLREAVIWAEVLGKPVALRE